MSILGCSGDLVNRPAMCACVLWGSVQGLLGDTRRTYLVN